MSYGPFTAKKSDFFGGLEFHASLWSGELAVRFEHSVGWVRIHSEELIFPSVKSNGEFVPSIGNRRGARYIGDPVIFESKCRLIYAKTANYIHKSKMPKPQTASAVALSKMLKPQVQIAVSEIPKPHPQLRS